MHLLSWSVLLSCLNLISCWYINYLLKIHVIGVIISKLGILFFGTFLISCSKVIRCQSLLSVAGDTFYFLNASEDKSYLLQMLKNLFPGQYSNDHVKCIWTVLSSLAHKALSFPIILVILFHVYQIMFNL